MLRDKNRLPSRQTGSVYCVSNTNLVFTVCPAASTPFTVVVSIFPSADTVNVRVVVIFPHFL
jgi:hypothetical protein